VQMLGSINNRLKERLIRSKRPITRRFQEVDLK